MSGVQGVVEQVNFRELAAQTQFGGTHGVSIKVAGVTYGAGFTKSHPTHGPQLRVQAGKEWVTISPGDTVQFFTKSRTVGDKTYVDIEGKARLVAKGNGQPPAQATAPVVASTTGTAPGQRAAYSAPSNDGLQVRIENGQAFNIACELLISSEQELTLANILPILSTVHKLRGECEAAGWGRAGNVQAAVASVPKASAAVSPAVVSVKQPTPVVAAEDFSDDALPF